ncbi:hypothetical protein [Acidisphaera sp. S103]|uniref:hypothetical protein n=1 Tax=Acidisphaera sp. S103 TaxID=1747223 RepID=UPI00131B5A37|nr:hypothetical protein [Acidisphaera sp. S103]
MPALATTFIWSSASGGDWTAPANWSQTSLTNGDTFDLRSALAATTWDQQLSDLGNYLTIGTQGSNALVQISTVSGGTPITVAILNGAGSVSLNTFISHALLT